MSTVRSNRPPLVSRPGDPEAKRRDERPVQRGATIQVSNAFWRKARAICTTKLKVSVLFERAMDLAIAEYTAKGIACPKAPALPEHRHSVFEQNGEAVYFYGRLGIAVDERCRLIGVGVAPHAGDD